MEFHCKYFLIYVFLALDILFTTHEICSCTTQIIFATQEDNGGKKRRSGDSKYGFSSSSGAQPPNSNGGMVAGSSSDKQANLNESIDDLPLPPHPTAPVQNGVQHGSPPAAAAGSAPPVNGKTNHRYSAHFGGDQVDGGGGTPSGGSSSGGGGGPNGPKVPPKIDRQKKPSRRSASERLFGNGEVSGNYINSENSSTATPPSSGKSSQQHHTPRTHSSSLDRHTHIRDMKLVRVLHSIWLPTNICELQPNTYHFSLCMTASTLTTRTISSPHH